MDTDSWSVLEGIFYAQHKQHMSDQDGHMFRNIKTWAKTAYIEPNDE